MSQPERRERASLYVRLSREAGTANVSLAGMERDLRGLAEREGLEVVDLHVDDGLSGALRERPAYRAWLADAEEGRADVLAAWSVDRMTREGLVAAAELMDLHERTGVRLMDTRGLDSQGSDAWRLRFVIEAEVARAERERMRARGRSKDRRLREAGRWPGGPPPFGYRIVDNPDGPGRVLEPVPEEAEVVRLAARRVLSGEPLARAVRHLNEACHFPRRAPRWTRTALRQVLTGDSVLGRIIVGGEPLRDDTGAAVVAWEPVLALEDVLALRELLEPARDPSKAQRYPARVASNLLTCHACGEPLQVARRTRGDVTYRCATRANGGLCERPVVIAAEPVERYLGERFLRMTGRFPALERRKVRPSDVSTRAAELDDAITATAAGLARDPDPEAFERLRLLRAERDALAAEPAGEVREEWVETGRTVREEWEVSDEPRRNAMLARFFVEVVVGPGRRGPRGLDPARLEVVTVADPDLGHSETL